MTGRPVCPPFTPNQRRRGSPMSLFHESVTSDHEADERNARVNYASPNCGSLESVSTTRRAQGRRPETGPPHSSRSRPLVLCLDGIARRASADLQNPGSKWGRGAFTTSPDRTVTCCRLMGRIFGQRCTDIPAAGACLNSTGTLCSASKNGCCECRTSWMARHPKNRLSKRSENPIFLNSIPTT
jgi:hypothetical protein